MIAPHLIYEPANSHGGDSALLVDLIDKLAEMPYSNRAIKFHPIAASTLARRDFSDFAVYQALEIPESRWREVIEHAHRRIGAVWIETADANCAHVLAENIGFVKGIKLQTSILDNHEVYSALQALDLSSKILMLNISGYEIDAITDIVRRFTLLKPKSLALQIGFQAYPTAIEDTLLNKLSVLRASFPDCMLGIADHVDGSHRFARTVPLLAMVAGCSILEKHVCLDRSTAPYDRSAALEPAEMGELQKDLELATACFGERFIAQAETEYLRKTLQRPITRHPVRKGQLVARQDLLFRRTNQPGMAMTELDALQTSFHILRHAKEADAPLFESDFGEAHIATIVAGRMKSTRLRRKATLPVNGIASVERCLETCLLLPYVRTVVLATSTSPEDDVLESHALSGKVPFFRGDAENVIHRFLGACDKHEIDVVVRATADCLTLSPEVTKILLEEHFAAGADFTRARVETPGTAPQIFNTETLRRIEELSGGARYSEYMNQYVEHNPEYFKIHWVDLPDDLIRPYRLTLDYAEDLQMYEALFAELSRQSKPATTRNVFDILDARPDIRSLNAHISQIYLNDPKLKAELQEATTFKRDQ